jgi:hypothetical protein
MIIWKGNRLLDINAQQDILPIFTNCTNKLYFTINRPNLQGTLSIAH